MRTSCEKQGQDLRFPTNQNPFWFRDDLHPQFDAALAQIGGPGVASNVRIAHLDTGYDPNTSSCRTAFFATKRATLSTPTIRMTLPMSQRPREQPGPRNRNDWYLGRICWKRLNVAHTILPHFGQKTCCLSSSDSVAGAAQ
jgi:hypothetical protein